MPQLDPTWYASQLFWLAITFTVLYALVRWLVLPRLVGVIETRQSVREGDLAAAERLKKEAEHAKLEYERTVTEARDRARQVFSDAELKFKHHAENAHKQLDAKLVERAAEAENAIDTKRKELARHMDEAGKQLASSIVEKFTGAKPPAPKVEAALKTAQN